MNILRIAQAQINTTVGDIEGNAGKILAGVDRALEAGAHLVTFPELALSGYPPEDLLLRPSFLRDTRLFLENLAKKIKAPVVVAGFPESDSGKVFNSAAVIFGAAIKGIYRKNELPNYGVFDEKRYFSPGNESLFLNLNGALIGLSICEDIWIPDGVVEKSMARAGADVVINISASPFHAGKLELRRAIVSGFAAATGAAVAYNNLVGGQDELVFDGGTLVMDPEGELTACADLFREDFLVTDININRSRSDKHPFVLSLSKHEHNESQNRTVIQIDYSPDVFPEMAPRVSKPEMTRVEEVFQALALGTGDYVRKNGFRKVVMGLSGGIDSTLTAVIAAEALGVENVVGVTIPSRFTSSETKSDAELLARNLGIKLLTIPMEPVFAAYLNILKEAMGPEPPGIENENLQARIRGNILMALSNRFGWLVLTTGNKSETAVGYCTLYGDMAGGFAVIKDVPKTLVCELSEYVNQRAGRELIPISVIIRPPTAELKPGQKDEDSLPPYAVLDPILRAYIEEDKAPDEIAAMGFDIATILDVVKMVDRNEYKRRQAPPGIKITPKAFGRDRRLPITNRYRPWK